MEFVIEGQKRHLLKETAARGENRGLMAEVEAR
jgi:hypothetical protein